MMYHLRKDIACPKCKHMDFKIEEHIEQHPDVGKDDVFLSYWEIYCTHCDETIMRIDT